MFHRTLINAANLEDRIKRIEDKLFPRKRPTTSNQQMLLLKFTGLLDIIRELETTNENKYEILGKILNRDKDSVKKAYLQISRSDDDIFIPSNLQFVIDILENSGLDKLANEPRKELERIELNWAKEE